ASHIEKEKRNFSGSEMYLDSLGIEKDARMLCLNTSSTNSPLMLMERKGYTIHKNRRPYIEMALEWPHEHIVIQNQYLLSHTAAIYPEILNQIKRTHSNGKISLFKKENMSNQPLEQVLGLRNIETIISDKPDSSYCTTRDWFKTLSRDSSFYLTAPYSSKIEKEKLFPANIILPGNEIHSNKNFVEFIWKSNLYFNDRNKKTDLVFKIDWLDGTYSSSHYSMVNLVSEINQWRQVQILFAVPDLDKVKSVSTYFWNPEKNAFWIDDTELHLLENTFE
ncbi:MAG: hypothetical protein KJO64_05965, partial [Bacteroidia bacterium]|nr:hypothetical protein [Bacteroidia bacterium]